LHYHFNFSRHHPRSRYFVKAPLKRYIILTLTICVLIFIGVAVYAAIVTDTYTSSPNAPIPDASGSTTCPAPTFGQMTDALIIPDSGAIQNVRVGINITHSWIGDLRVTLTSPSGTTVLLFDNIRVGTSACGCIGFGEVNSTFDDTATALISDQCAANGVYPPQEPLSAFNGEEVTGTWTLTVYDRNALDTGTLVNWSLEVTYDEPVPSPTPTNTVFEPTTTVPAPTTTVPTSTPAPGLNVPNLGTVMIYRSQAQPAYQSPRGGVIRDAAGNELWLPHDSNFDGFDTYIVTNLRRVNDEVWVGLFLGSGSWGWVPLDGVTLLHYLPAAETASETAAEPNGEDK
jgi:subtilisin-like proprotein convertase family protein